jgi:hypothetical protein
MVMNIIHSLIHTVEIYIFICRVPGPGWVVGRVTVRGPHLYVGIQLGTVVSELGAGGK